MARRSAKIAKLGGGKKVRRSGREAPKTEKRHLDWKFPSGGPEKGDFFTVFGVLTPPPIGNFQAEVPKKVISHASRQPAAHPGAWALRVSSSERNDTRGKRTWRRGKRRQREGEEQEEGEKELEERERERERERETKSTARREQDNERRQADKKTRRK